MQPRLGCLLLEDLFDRGLACGGGRLHHLADGGLLSAAGVLLGIDEVPVMTDVINVEMCADDDRPKITLRPSPRRCVRAADAVPLELESPGGYWPTNDARRLLSAAMS
jgi:hypothetical protein